MNTDGSNRRSLVQTVSNDFDPCWSPDCEYIAFQTSYGNNDDEVGNISLCALIEDYLLQGLE